MKNLLILACLSFFSMTAFAQKVAKVTVATSESLSTSFQKCIDAGREAKYGSKDVDLKTGKATLWKSVPSMSGAMYEYQILISSETKDDKTIFTFRMPHVPGVLINFKKELKKCVDNINLPDMIVGEYFDGIE